MYADSGITPLQAGAGGAAVGVAGTLLLQDVKKAKSRANWSLAIGIGVLGIMLVNSGNLQSATTTAQQLAITSNSLAFDAAVTGIQVAGLRSVVTQLANNQANIAYYANSLGNWFQTQPQAQSAPVQIAAVASTTVVQNSSNSNLALLLLIGVVGVAVVMS